MSTNTTERPISGWLGSGKASAGRVVVSIVTILLLSIGGRPSCGTRRQLRSSVLCLCGARRRIGYTRCGWSNTRIARGSGGCTTALLDALRRVPETGSRAERHYSVGVYYDHAKWAMGTIGAWIEGEGPNWADSPWFLVALTKVAGSRSFFSCSRVSQHPRYDPPIRNGH